MIIFDCRRNIKLLLSLLSFQPYLAVISACILAAVLTAFSFVKLSFLLPRDHGRAFAIEGQVSKGKPTGAGIFFILAFAIVSLLFMPMQVDYILYIICISLAMLFGYLDDGAKKPWSEYIKGALDLLISLVVAITYAIFSGCEILFPILNMRLDVPIPIFIALAAILVWVAINVTNCTDGVDGLSSSLSIIAIVSFMLLMHVMGTMTGFSTPILVMAAVLIVYLWFNTNPSKLLMGDAGSRAIGVFLAIVVLQSRMPLAYLALCLIFILDGSSGIVKISLKRFLRISILKNTLTPLHDHLRKRLNWPNQQVTVRVSILQCLISALYISAVLLTNV